jgi:hypothetical protein
MWTMVLTEDRIMQKENLMKSKSKDLKKTVSDKKALLGHVLKKNEKIKDSVKKAAGDLTSVNKVLKQKNVPKQVMKGAQKQ